jgi:hypothetical protein
VAPGEERYSTYAGAVFSQGRSLHLTWLSFRSLPDGAPALVAWLRAKGCTDFKYDLRAESSPALLEKD